MLVAAGGGNGLKASRVGVLSSGLREGIEFEVPIPNLSFRPLSMHGELRLGPIATLLRYGTLEPKWSIPTGAPFPAGAPNSHRCPIPRHITTSLRYDARVGGCALLKIPTLGGWDSGAGGALSSIDFSSGKKALSLFLRIPTLRLAFNNKEGVAERITMI